jgi:hypothetical protein
MEATVVDIMEDLLSTLAKPRKVRAWQTSSKLAPTYMAWRDHSQLLTLPSSWRPAPCAHTLTSMLRSYMKLSAQRQSYSFLL